MARYLRAAALAAALSLACGTAQAGADSPVRIYLFGPWLDATGWSVMPLALEVRRCGVVTVHPHTAWESMVPHVRRMAVAGAVVLAGYSMGGNAARDLAAAVAPARVEALVTIDPSGGRLPFAPAIGAVPGNVRRKVNLVQVAPVWGGGRPAGALNIPLAINHLDFMSSAKALGIAATAICGTFSQRRKP